MKHVLVVLALSVAMGLAGCRKPAAADPPPDAGPSPDRVTGKAENAKLGAIVITESGGAVYCQGLDAWPSEVRGSTVTVEGTLETTDAFKAVTGPDGAISQGTAGGDQVLRDCRRVE